MNQSKILFVVDALDDFSHVVQLDMLSRELASDFEVHVVVLCGGPIEQWPDSERHMHFLEQHSVSLGDRGLSWRRLGKSGFRLRKLCRRLQPEIVHAWGKAAEVIALLGLNASQHRKFVTRSNLISTGSLTVEKGIQKLAEGVEKYIVPHEEVKASMVAQRYDESKFEIVPTAVPDGLQKFPAREKLLQLAGLRDDSKLAATVAPLVARSRLKDTIWATDLLTCIRDDVHFFIFGRGSQRQRLEKFASQTEAGGHVHFVPVGAHAVDLLPGVDFFWQSHLREPLSASMLYAMKCGVPVVSVYGPGTAEVIRHQETGFAVNFGARDEFARWTKFLLEQTDSGQQLAIQGRDSVSGKFGIHQMAHGYRKVYAK